MGELSKREYARKYLAPFLSEIGVGETINVVADLVHDAYGEFDVDQLGRYGTSIRPWTRTRPDLRIEPDPKQDTVKITRVK